MSYELDDSKLYQCNETELLEMARLQGLGRLKRGLPLDELVDIVRGAKDPGPEHLDPSTYSRARLEAFINRNWGKIRSQLPGCNGRCTTFGCTETQHRLCYLPNRDALE